MYRRTVITIAAAVVAAAVAIPALAAGGARHKKVHFTQTGVGAAINSKQFVYKVHDSLAGNGATVQTLTSSTSTGGTDRTISYFRHGSDVSVDSFKLGKPNAQGQIPISGSGHVVSGTGSEKGSHAKYTFTGTYDPKTKIVRYTAKGTA